MQRCTSHKKVQTDANIHRIRNFSKCTNRQTETLVKSDGLGAQLNCYSYVYLFSLFSISKAIGLYYYTFSIIYYAYTRQDIHECWLNAGVMAFLDY